MFLNFSLIAKKDDVDGGKIVASHVLVQVFAVEIGQLAARRMARDSPCTHQFLKPPLRHAHISGCLVRGQHLLADIVVFFQPFYPLLQAAYRLLADVF